jgi:hypothetical protein
MIAAILCLQSLADIARQEAERRRQLDRQGIEAKSITMESAASASPGNVTLSSMPPSSTKQKNTTSADARENRSVRGFSSALRKLDNAIRQTEGRLQTKRTSAQSQSGALLKGKNDSRGKSASRLQEEIRELEMKLEQLKQERLETYQAGKKAGFLPGELDGKGIIP